MEKVETNSSLIINFFKKNYIKMIAFIVASIVISLFLSIEKNKKAEFFYSKFQVIFNKSVYILGKKQLISHFDLDFIYFLEKKGIRNSKLLKNINTSDVVQIEIQHKSLDDKGTIQYNENLNLVEDYRKKVLTNLDESIKIYLENANKGIANENEKKIKRISEEAILHYVSGVEELKYLVSNNDVFFVSYDGIIHSRKVNTILKNIIVTFCVNVIIILLILWLKIFLREMRKNT